MLGLAPRPVAEAIRRLANTDPDFAQILKWLEDERASLVTTLSVHRDDVTVRQHQGAVQLLDDLKQRVEQAKR